MMDEQRTYLGRGFRRLGFTERNLQHRQGHSNSHFTTRMLQHENVRTAYRRRRGDTLTAIASQRQRDSPPTFSFRHTIITKLDHTGAGAPQSPTKHKLTQSQIHSARALPTHPPPSTPQLDHSLLRNHTKRDPPASCHHSSLRGPAVANQTPATVRSPGASDERRISACGGRGSPRSATGGGGGGRGGRSLRSCLMSMSVSLGFKSSFSRLKLLPRDNGTL